MKSNRPPGLLVGGGMISREVILPTLFQERRRGKVGDIAIASRRTDTILELREIFPGEEFKGYPDPSKLGAGKSDPDAYKRALAELGEEWMVIVATPDDLHTPVILEAIATGHHMVVEKPLCLKTGLWVNLLQSMPL